METKRTFGNMINEQPVTMKNMGKKPVKKPMKKSKWAMMNVKEIK